MKKKKSPIGLIIFVTVVLGVLGAFNMAPVWMAQMNQPKPISEPAVVDAKSPADIKASMVGSMNGKTAPDPSNGSPNKQLQPAQASSPSQNVHGKPAPPQTKPTDTSTPKPTPQPGQVSSQWW